ncbi:hypothetical protein [Candidatus Leptofilum sp.]|uniref:hypothetical protein n=1 Tax=Candidatus Leptofilum sp. TaxID=3241576 RepID=UPI003B5B21B3
MKYHSKDIAVTHKNISVKTAALLYKYVFPLAPKIYQDSLPSAEYLHHLLPEFAPKELKGTKIPPVISVFQWYIYQIILLIRDMAASGDDFEKAKPAFIELEKLSKAVSPNFSALMLHVWPDVDAYERALRQWILHMENGFNLTCSNVEQLTLKIDNDNTPNLEGSDPCIVLANLDLIDAESLEWNQILNIRTDEESALRLRRLRTFMFENFDGMPKSYIEDKLGVMVEDYKAAVEKHGAGLVKTAIQAVASDKFLTGATAGVLAAVAGATVPISSAIGAVASLAGVLIEVRSSRQKAKIDFAQSPVRFIIDIENAAGQN